jgi:hypothetical protein
MAPPKRMTTIFDELVEAEIQRRKYETLCTELRTQLGLPTERKRGRGLAEAAELLIDNGAEPPPKRSSWSPEARARLGAGMRRWWARKRKEDPNYSTAKAHAQKATRTWHSGKKMSPEALAKLQDTAAKARAARARKRDEALREQQGAEQKRILRNLYQRKQRLAAKAKKMTAQTEVATDI